MFKKCFRPIHLTKISIGKTKVAQRIAFASAVPNLAGDHKMLFIALNRLVNLTKAVVG